MPAETCLSCSSSKFSVAPTASDNVELITCQDCGTAWTHPCPAASELDNHYSSTYYGPENVKFISTLERIVNWVTYSRAQWISRLTPPHSRILEVGCGRGLLLKALSELGYECHGTERSEMAAARAYKTVGIKLYTKPLDECGFPENSFDLVTLWHVFEHMENPAATLAAVHRILKPGGKLILEVPNFSSWQSRLTGKHWFHLDLNRHLYHFSKQGLAQILCRAGFKVTQEMSFSLEQCPYGALQSFLNLMTSRDRLYQLLKREISLPLPAKLFHFGLAGLLLVPAFLFSLLETLMGQGGVLRVVAQKVEAPMK